jgi:hypothetical protein
MSDLSQDIADFRYLDTTKSTAYYYQCIKLASIYDTLIAKLGEGEGEAEYQRIRREELGLGDVVMEDGRVKKRGGVASKMLTVGRNLKDAPQAIHELPANFQYYLAKALMEGNVPREDLYADAASMPQRDFIERHELVKVRKPKAEPTGRCFQCGAEGPMTRFREASNED